MKSSEVFEYFGNQKKAAAKLGLTPQAVSAWGEYPPIGRQFQIQIKSRGRLRVTEPELQQ